jgi:hypothetical protein
MTPDLLLIPLAVGHLVLFVLVVNVAHGLGKSEHVMTRVKLGLLGTYAVVSAALIWEASRASLPSWSSPTLVYAAVCLVFALVIFPAATARLHRRDRPEGIDRRSEAVDLAEPHGRDALRGVGRHAWMLKLPGNEATWLHKVEYEVAIPGLPVDLDGLSLLHISDLHFATAFDVRYFEAVADEAASMAADLVTFTGDLVDDDAAIDWVGPVLSRMRGRLGSFAILGNHDLDHQPERIKEQIRTAGFTDMDGHWATVRVGGSTVAQ